MKPERTRGPDGRAIPEPVSGPGSAVGGDLSPGESDSGNPDREACVVCGSSLVALNISEPMAIRAGRRVLPSDTYRLSECVDCSLAQTTFEVSQPELNDLYANEDDQVIHEVTGRSPESISADRVPEFEHAVEFILRSHGDPGGSMLDVGCQDGTFLGIARTRGYDVYGAELSRYHSARARERLGPDRVVTAGIEELGGDRVYDVVTLLETLEHLADPRDGLERLKALGKPRGSIIVSVPSWRYFRLKGHVLSVAGLLMRRRFRGQVHTHVTVYTLRALCAIGQECGLEMTHAQPGGWHGRLRFMNRVCGAANRLRIPVLKEIAPSLIVRFERGTDHQAG